MSQMIELFQTIQPAWLNSFGHVRNDLSVIAVSLVSPYFAGYMLESDAAALLDAHKEHKSVALQIVKRNGGAYINGKVTAYRGAASSRIEIEIEERDYAI